MKSSTIYWRILSKLETSRIAFQPTPRCTVNICIYIACVVCHQASAAPARWLPKLLGKIDGCVPLETAVSSTQPWQCWRSISSANIIGCGCHFDHSRSEQSVSWIILAWAVSNIWTLQLKCLSNGVMHISPLRADYNINNTQTIFSVHYFS